jgi:signal transduction histidine kinase
MDFYAVSALINAFTSSILGLVILFKNPKGRTNVGFFLFAMSVFCWSLPYYFWQISTNGEDALFLTRLLMMGAIFIPVADLHFVYSVTNLIEKRKKFLIFSYFLFFCFFISNFTPYFVSHVEPLLNFQFWPIAGPFFSLYLILWVFYAYYAAYVLFKAYKKSKGIYKTQLKYITIGTIIGYTGGITNYFLWYKILIPPIGNITASIYLIFIVYAIIRYRFMDIRIMVRQIFIYLGVSTFAYGFFYSLVWFYNTFFNGVFTLGAYSFGLIVAPLFVITFYNANKVIRNFANKYLFTSLYNYQETISKLTEELTNHIDLNTITKLIVTTIKDTMRIEKANVFLINTRTLPCSYKLFTIKGIKKDSSISSIRDSYLIDYLSKTQKIIVSDELSIFAEENKNEESKIKFKELISYMENINASVILPLIANKKLIGVIILSSKKSQNPYTKEDLELLTILSRQASIAIENARQYRQIKEFGKTLEEKVSKQTKDIRRSNKYLQELLAMKSDFLRVVSHQLNTPLSIIRGYFSMMKEGDYKPETALPVIEAGLYRIVNTVADFCDAYKLEGEKMETKPEKVNIEPLIRNIIKEKLEYIKEKKLKIIIKKPNFTIPKLWCDPEKTSRAISNLIENAISYTEKGNIELSFTNKKDFLEINIKDEGCGITKDDREKIFQKFSRGNRAPNIHPDGSGLGLYITKKIVEGNGGEIYFESKGENKGTTFSFTTPIYKNQDKKILKKKTIK